MGFLTRCKRLFSFAFLLQNRNTFFSFFLKSFLILSEKQQGADSEICRWRYFLSVKKAGKGRRGFAVGAPARRSRDGNGKTSAPVGPMTGQPGFAAGEMRPNGSKGRGGNGSRVWEKRKASAFAGPITKSADGVTFLMLRK